MNKALSGLVAMALVACLVSPVLAQETAGSQAGAGSDWEVLQEIDPVECYAVAWPESQENTQDGQPVVVARGETRLFVLFRPAEDMNGQVSFTGGYPFGPSSVVTLEVENTRFALFTQDEWAWAPSAKEDAQIVAALRGGSEAVLTGQSERGTVTRDTFSLQGFSESVNEAQSRCAG